MKRQLAILSATILGLMLALPAAAQKMDRGLSLSTMPSFTQKGKWMAGGTASWTIHNNDNYSALIAEGLTSTGYSVKVSPAFCYMLKDNLGVGVRAGYSRSNMKLDEMKVGFGDLSMDISDLHTLRHNYQVQGIMRNYIPIGQSKKIALYNEIQLGYNLGTTKMAIGLDDEYDGTFSDSRKIELNFCPGITAFANDHWAVDVNVNMLGLGLSQMEQSHNQVSGGSMSYTHMSFQVNVLAIGFGLYYYL